jgi:hypothetical protein
LTLKTLLQFWIATPYVTPDALVVEVEPCIALPKAAVCFFTLFIPGAHATYKPFKAAFHTALTHGAQGFGEQ